jgi:hypothetical protein
MEGAAEFGSRSGAITMTETWKEGEVLPVVVVVAVVKRGRISCLAHDGFTSVSFEFVVPATQLSTSGRVALAIWFTWDVVGRYLKEG